MDTKLKEIRANIEKIDKSYREIKGYGECCDTAKPCEAELKDQLYMMIQSVYRYIDYVSQNVYNWQYDHTKNSTHLPKLSASQTEKLLKAAGAAEDFDVIKPSIFARANRNGNTEFIVDVIKPK